LGRPGGRALREHASLGSLPLAGAGSAW